MKKTLRIIWLSVLYIIAIPVMAQSSDLLLYTVSEDEVADTVHLLNVAIGEVSQIAQLIGEGYEAWKDVGWSPDGRYVWMVDMPVEGQRRLRVYDTIDGMEQTINEDLIPYDCNASLDWSPNGKYLSYFTWQETNRDLTVMNLANDIIYPLSDGISMSVWSPDEQYFMAGIRAQNGNQPILVRVSDGVELRNFNAYSGHFSPDSRFVAYQDKTIWVYGLANEEPINLEIRGRIEQWSPNSRYILIQNDTDITSYSYYNIETHTLSAIETNYPQHFIGWTHDNIALIRGYLPDNGGQVLFSYDPVNGELQSILETADSFSITSNEDWIVALLYPTDDLKNPNPYRPATQIQFISGKTVIEAELTVYTYHPFTKSKTIAWSPDGKWLALLTAQGLYQFNTQTGVLEQVPSGNNIIIGTLHWSADGQYLVFQSRPEKDTPSYITVWDTLTDTINVWENASGRIIGMQNTNIQNSLLSCGMG